MNLSPSVTDTTFRDPAGRLYRNGDRVLREICPEHSDSVLEWVRSSLARRWIQERRLVATKVLGADGEAPVLLEHERIFFPTYPWEWTPSQWIEAGTLTLDLCKEALDEGFILKDATPLNVLFSGHGATFVDILSFERRDLKSPLWIAYAQFVRTFLLPLCAHAYLGWPLSCTQQRRDGYEPSDLAPFLPLFRRLCRPLLSLVTIPLLLGKRPSAGSHRPQIPEDAAAFALRRLLQSTRTTLRALAASARASRWSRYVETAQHYDSADHRAKHMFVSRTLGATRPAHVLDVGANTGVYSRIAAERGASVVAWDSDMQASDLNWQSARSAGLSILPLVADFARPTPAVGWRNRESESLLDRARGQFDCVLMLGILHHLLIADQIPLPAIVDQLSEISTRWVIAEWIPKGDSQFDELSRGRDELYAHLTEEFFIQSFAKCFSACCQEQLPNGRSLWLMEKI